MTTLKRLEAWYAAQCDGDWEHSFGVQVDTLDNPGWTVDIDLEGTALADAPFEEVAYGVGDDAAPSEDDWMVCKVQEKRFVGVGGPHKLDEIFETFLNWADQQGQEPEE